MSNVRKMAAFSIFGLVVNLTVLGSFVKAGISVEVSDAFPAESCLNTQPKASPQYLLCWNVNMHLGEISSRRNDPDGPGPVEIVKTLVKILIEDGDPYMAAYLMAMRGNEEDAGKALKLMEDKILVGANWIRAAAHTTVAAANLQEKNLADARRFIEQAQREVVGAKGKPGHLISGRVMQTSAEVDIKSGDFKAALVHGRAAADSFVEAGSPMAPGLLLGKLASSAELIDRETALTFRDLSDTYACKYAEAWFCSFVKKNSELFRAHIDKLNPQ